MPSRTYPHSQHPLVARDPTSVGTHMTSTIGATSAGPDGSWGHMEQWNIANPIVTDRDGRQKLKLTFDVRQFRPEEISVKTTDQNLTVYAKHQEESPDSKVYREYNRQYLLPTSVDPVTLKSVMSPEGVLTIEAPVKGALEPLQERLVPITHTRSSPERPAIASAHSTGAHP